MTKIMISRATVIKAIKEEPLLRPLFFVASTSNKPSEPLASDTKNCQVCAVGAVLRECIEPNQNWRKLNGACLSSLYDDDSNPTNMNKLSAFFEKTWSEVHDRTKAPLSRHQIYRIRLKTIEFVKKNFPAKLEIDINGALPAKGIKVINAD